MSQIDMHSSKLLLLVLRRCLHFVLSVFCFIAVPCMLLVICMLLLISSKRGLANNLRILGDGLQLWVVHALPCRFFFYCDCWCSFVAKQLHKDTVLE